MNLSQETKNLAVPASAAVATYALANEFAQRAVGSGPSASIVAALVASAGAHLFYQAADPQTKTAFEQALLPLGFAGAVKTGLERLKWTGSNPRARNLLTAAGAGAALYAFALRPTTPAVGMLPPYQG